MILYSKVFKVFVGFLYLFKVSLSLDVNRLQENLPVVVGVMLEASEDLVGGKCFHDIQYVLQGISDRQLWALQILDASGNRPSGYLSNNNMWLGSKTACMAVNTQTCTRSVNEKKIEETFEMEVDYRIVSSSAVKRHNMRTRRFFHLGLCLPMSCSLNETLLLTENFFNGGHVSFYRNISVSFTQVRTLNKSTGDFWNDCNFRIFIYLTIMWTILTISSSHSEKICKHVEKLGINSNCLRRVLLCFHFPSNFSKVLSTNVLPNELTAVTALKTICGLIVPMTHITHLRIWRNIVWGSDSHLKSCSPNLPNGDINLKLKTVNSFLDTDRVNFKDKILIATSLELFFVCSGLLATYSFCRNLILQKKIKENTLIKNMKLYLRFIVNRYLRLMPMVIFVLLLAKITCLYLDVINTQDGWNSFSNQWFLNFLLMLNLYGWSDVVLGLWYMSSDMQLYVIFTAIVFIRTKYYRLGNSIIILAIIGGVLLTFYMYYCGFSLHTKNNYYTLINYTFLSRISSYGIGVIIGSMLVQAKNPRILNLAQRIRIISCFIAAFIVFAKYNIEAKTYNTFVLAIFITTARILFALFVGFYLYLTHFGHFKEFQRLGSSTFVQRISRVSYAFFLVHNIIINLTFEGQVLSSENYMPMLIVSYFGIVSVTYLVSVMATTTVEIPFLKFSSDFVMGPIGKTKKCC
ncbi:hypothetical protein DMENIID0001_056340 [Sergentomyia squamirostris]